MIHDRASALALIDAVGQRLLQRGLVLRRPPPEPLGCCGRGCNGCVWQGWFEAVAWWRDEALAALDQAGASVPASSASSA